MHPLHLLPLLLALAPEPPPPTRVPTQAPLTSSASPPPDVTEHAGPAEEEGPLEGSVLDELSGDRRAKAHYERTSCRRTRPDLCFDIALEYEPGGPTPDPAIAAAVYERACDLGHWKSCSLLALAYTEAHGVKRNLKRAARLYERACLEGHVAGACNNLALHYGSGLGVPIDLARSVVLFEKACAMGDALGCQNARAAEAPPREPPVDNRSLAALPEARRRELVPLLERCTRELAWQCTNWGTLWAKGLGGRARDFAVAAAFFEQGCARGDPTACKNLANQAMSGQGVPRDAQRAAALYRGACDAGLSTACVNLGSFRLAAGADAEAAPLFERACKLRDALGCNDLGWVHERGRGVKADAVRALRLYLQACGAGLAMACRNVGTLFLTGNGPTADAAQAARRFGQGCDGGDVAGCVALASLHLGGRGVPRDVARARELLTRGCEQGSAAGCVNLGYLNDVGEGGPEDDPRALSLYVRGCDGGDGVGCANAALLLEEKPALLPPGTRLTDLEARACNHGVKSACPQAAAP